ncbi:MAG: ABC transporter substrate-binding protein [Propionicimonas sp.]|uniref:ABC transporter substrate-binding protein n=1 Tax=Propionicimonas sp. TaxID=1955623 RepID=UPI002B1F256F|nr:ABC transporter substrate-binding protein [Propionicimonas sp.]MEA4944877.1 ABC transporter substrate-binding protein [Propionicimonas sp.]MEA5053095.1 ABC transporter substrate-binding protein [Propionicimonas sp.]MEA5116753.1 ABC transporter substrate-binding protein [Propionicimonas sp.]
MKIGFISAFTGVFSSFGKMQREGAELALEEAGGKAGGKQIDVIYEDDQLDNEIAVTKAKKLVEQDKVDILTGLVSGDEGLAVGDYMKDKEIPVVVMYSAAEDMTMRSFSENIIRPTWTGAQSMDVFGYWLAKEKGYKKIYQIGEDYSFPWNTGGGFKRGFCRGGGTEVKSVWFPPGTTSDFSSLIASIPLDQGYDALFYNGAGGDAVNFIKQYVELGMIGKMPLVGQPNTFEKPDLDAMPADIAGSLSPQHTADDLATPEWTKFADAFKVKYGYAPSAAAEFAYSSMKLILRSIDQTSGNVADRKALIDAMAAADITDDPRGPVKLDPKWHSATQNVYIREVAKDDSGALYNKGLWTVTEVSQFGVYDPDTYMAAPPDSNTSPSDQCADLGALLTAPTEYQYQPFGS